MNKTIIVIALIAICVVAFGATGRVYEDGNYYKTIVYETDYTSAQSNTEAVSDITGISLVVDKIKLTAASATYMYINDTGINTTHDVDSGYFRVPGNGTFVEKDMFLKLTASAGIYVTTGGACEIKIEYHKE